MRTPKGGSIFCTEIQGGAELQLNRQARELSTAQIRYGLHSLSHTEAAPCLQSQVLALGGRKRVDGLGEKARNCTRRMKIPAESTWLS